jgi:hypothetical protein
MVMHAVAKHRTTDQPKSPWRTVLLSAVGYRSRARRQAPQQPHAERHQPVAQAVCRRCAVGRSSRQQPRHCVGPAADMCFDFRQN